ncbi:hypothetical protein COY33_00685 [candidate division WWE3 bacterium CG_4_10_14_0_2_um_filter_42_7]|uniref:Methyltransferase type 11 domain-containing protein n=2 Tax=Katanobacteria TaxID=422282 RepID=A0A2H0X9Z0_UNCKA|nr:MAG: hypothetical protein COT51_01970 [candidate division WWE3 bacterium CG08_land_8_20_14_0_20_41_15]PIZ43876.1 MAG: hypothetical protein COY33_00685 [candidate division WWE3 bacterium CG_4_10_14_0_2_um_filter_42_7]
MKKDQKEFFDDLAAGDYAPLRSTGSFAVKRINKIVLDFVLGGVKTDARILELGCGKGPWTLLLLELGYKVTAVDFSPKSLKILEERARSFGFSDRLTTYEKDITKPLALSGFERVFCIDTLHHISNPAEVVLQMSRAVVTGGKVSVLEPNPFNLWWWIGAPLFDKYFDLSIESGMTKTSPQKLRGYFEKADITKIEILPLELFPMISPDRLPLIIKIENFLYRLPFVKNFSAINLCGGWKD